MSNGSGVEEKVREIRRQTRRKYSAEEKIRIVLEGLRGEESIAELSGAYFNDKTVVTFDQLIRVKSLYRASNFPEKILLQLREAKPELFAAPK